MYYSSWHGKETLSKRFPGCAAGPEAPLSWVLCTMHRWRPDLSFAPALGQQIGDWPLLVVGVVVPSCGMSVCFICMSSWWLHSASTFQHLCTADVGNCSLVQQGAYQSINSATWTWVPVPRYSSRERETCFFNFTFILPPLF